MVEVTRADADDLDRWDDLVERSPQGTPFHRRGALEVLADHSGAELHPLIGYKGQEPVGLFPVFELSRGPVTGAFSPPPDLKVSYGGPILVNFGKLKRRKAQRRHRKFVDGCMEYVDETISPAIFSVRSAVRYDDARSFAWNGFDVTTRYTYVVDVSTDPDDLLSAFSSDARRNVTNDYDADVSIEEGGVEAIERIMAQVRARHEEQGESFPLETETVIDLYEALPAGTLRPYVCTVDGEYAGGIIAPESSDTIYRWQGGTKTDADVPVNDLLDWRIIRDAADRGLTRYDLVGANNPRISSYKAKFAPELATFHQMTRSTRAMDLATDLYDRLRTSMSIK